MEDQYVSIGIVTKKYSFRGEVLVKIESYALEALLSVDYLLIGMDANIVPFPVEHIKTHNRNLLRIKVQGISDEQQAETITQKIVYIPAELLKSKKGHLNPHEVVGIAICDKTFGYIGTVTEVNTSTPQTLLTVSNNEKDVLVPFIKELIINIDREQRQILMDLPEGILDL